MKLNYFLLATLCCLTFFNACKSDSDSVRDAAVQSAGGTATPADGSASVPMPALNQPAANPTQVTAPPAEPPQNAAGVWHYTCPKGCAGGGGTATACAKCGATLAHNAAYHNAGANPATPGTAGAPAITTTPTTTPITPPANATEPPQNKAGVWHYTCPKGCAGGGGSATACAKCGATLAHNQTYHQ